MSWTDERVETLKKLWSDGLSCSQIAQELGSVSRNAVIGKVHRLGLSGRAKTPSSVAPRQRKPRTGHQSTRAQRIRGKKEPTQNESLLATGDVDLMTFIDMVKPAELHGSVIPLHESDAFPKPTECGLSHGILLAIASMYRPVEQLGA